MTHDELLLKLDDYGFGVPPLNALRSVVELHKPEQTCFDATCYCADTCMHCHTKYPCLTIQSIEKELL